MIREEYNAAIASGNIPSSHPPTPAMRPGSLPLPGAGPLSAVSTTSHSPFTSINPPTSLASFVLLGLPRSTVDQHIDHPPTPRQLSSSLDVDDSNRKAVSVKPALIGAIEEVIDDLETVYENVAKNARDHIHSECVVPSTLPFGYHSDIEVPLHPARLY